MKFLKHVLLNVLNVHVYNLTSSNSDIGYILLACFNIQFEVKITQSSNSVISSPKW